MSEHYRPLSSYRGYGITKVWEEDTNHRIKKNTIKYLIDDGEDYIGTEYKTLSSAHSEINGWTNVKVGNKWIIRHPQNHQKLMKEQS